MDAIKVDRSKICEQGLEGYESDSCRDGSEMDGEGLTCGFNQKWMSPDGLTLWSIFSVYGKGAEIGIKAHDKFNIVKATLLPKR